MSANVDLVRPIHAALGTCDYSSAEWAHPEIEYAIADGPSPGRWTGVAGMNEAWRNFASAWEEWRVAHDECRELDGERVLILSHYTARGKRSGLEIGQLRTERQQTVKRRKADEQTLIHAPTLTHSFADRREPDLDPAHDLEVLVRHRSSVFRDPREGTHLLANWALWTGASPDCSNRRCAAFSS